jgi:hypothetical protein
MRNVTRPVAIALALLLLADALLALFGLPSAGSSDDSSNERFVAGVMVVLAIANVFVMFKPIPAAIIFNVGTLAGMVAGQHHRSAGTILWLALSALILAFAIYDRVATTRAIRVEAIHARIEEELIDSSLRPGD